jgi:hypothetical protein
MPGRPGAGDTVRFVLDMQRGYRTDSTTPPDVPASFTIRLRGFPPTFGPASEDGVAMNRNDRPIPQFSRRPTRPKDYIARRVSSLAIVGGAITGFLSAGILESAGLPEPVAVGAGLLAFVAATWLATFLAIGRPMSRYGEDAP